MMESMLMPREKAAVGKLILKGVRDGFKKFFPKQSKKLEGARTDPELQKDFESELTYNQLLKERDPSILEDPSITPSRREYLENNTKEEIKKSDKKLNKLITQMEKIGTGVGKPKGKGAEKPVIKQLQKLLIQPSEGQEVVKQIMQEGDNKAAYDIAFDKVGDTVALSAVAYALGTAEDDILGYLKDNNIDYDISKEGENTVINVLDSETEETSLSKKEYEKIINNTEEDVSIIEAKDTDKEFSMATDNPTKYVFMENNMPFYKTKDGVKALNLKTGEKGVDLALVPFRTDKAAGSLIGGQRALDKDDDGDIDGDDFAALRENKAHGSLSILMTPEMMPVDTYPNMSPEEEKAAKESQLPDEEMEDSYIDFVMDESLSEDEQDYLAEALEKDNKLSEIMDKVITTASEFSGAGEVDGPGTGVSDSIPARLSDGEFVFTKKATDQIGVDKLQTMMDDAEREFDEGQKKQMAFGGMLTDDPMQDEKQKDYMEGLLNTEDAIKQQMIRANRTPSVYANLR